MAAVVLVFGALAAGGVFITTWEMPAPTTTVEKVLPDDRFPR